MSYHLLAEGDLDLFEMSRLVPAYRPLELFPVPGKAGDGLGIALASNDATDATVRLLSQLIQLLWSKQVAVWDLMSGQRIANATDLVDLEDRILGR